MNWDQLEGQWKQMRGAVKKRWDKLTDDDLEYISGRRDQLVGRVQERYGILREMAEKQANEWVQGQAETKAAASHRTGGGESYSG